MDSLYAGVDTVSDGVTFLPVAEADPTQSDPACAPLPPEPLPALPPLAAQATFTPTPAASATPLAGDQAAVAPLSIVLPDNEPIDFPQFTLASLERLSLVDSAAHSPDDAIRLMQAETPTTLYAGALWSVSRQTLSGGFHTAFRFQVTHPVASGGDGFAFVIQNTSASAVGIGGCSNGYNGIPNVFAVEFDLYWNNARCPETHDPSDNHLGVMTGNHLHTDAARVRDVRKSTLDFKDGQAHAVVIDYKLDPPRLDIDLDDGRVTWTVNIDPAWLPLDGQGNAWVGLVAGQYEARANVDVLDWTFTHSQQTPTPTPTPTVPPTCPWGGEYLPNDTLDPDDDECGYTYGAAQRLRARDYALTWAHKACPLFHAFQYYPWVDETFLPLTSPSIRIPTPVGKENLLHYQGVGGGNTDCANFVSQALLYANLPMARGWFCMYGTGAETALCIRREPEPGLGIPAGWAEAAPGHIRSRALGTSHPLDDSRAGQPVYLGTRYRMYLAGEGTSVRGLGGRTTALSPDFNKDLNASLAFDLTMHIDPADPSYAAAVPSQIPDGSPIQSVVAAITHPDGLNVRAGDILITFYDQPGNEHVALVVGWGPYVETWGQLRTLYRMNRDDPRNFLIPDCSTACPANFVPYVVDHGRHGEYANVNPLLPASHTAGRARPYYALQWGMQPGGVDYFNRIASGINDRGRRLNVSFHFVQIPAAFSLPLSYVLQPEDTDNLPTLMSAYCPVSASVR